MLEENAWALKEWAVVCAALATGRQTVVLRKGGIAEGPRGFQVDHGEFWLLPTRFHQALDDLQPGASDLLSSVSAPPPGQLRLDLYAIVRDVAYIDREEGLDAYLRRQILSADTVRERFHYRRSGLFALELSVYRAPEAIILADRPEYAGCHSWVPLHDPISTRGLVPVGVPA
jgi:hypothetical protein